MPEFREIQLSSNDGHSKLAIVYGFHKFRPSPWFSSLEVSVLTQRIASFTSTIENFTSEVDERRCSQGSVGLKWHYLTLNRLA